MWNDWKVILLYVSLSFLLYFVDDVSLPQSCVSAVCRTVSRDWMGGGLWWFVRVRLRCGAGVWCDHGQCTVHGVPTTTTSLHCVTPHHNPRYSVPSVAPAQPQLSIFCRSSAPVSRIMIPPDLSPQSFLQLPQSSCKPKFSRGASRDSFNF